MAYVVGIAEPCGDIAPTFLITRSDQTLKDDIDVMLFLQE
jgi:hypothetical protein